MARPRLGGFAAAIDLAAYLAERGGENARHTGAELSCYDVAVRNDAAPAMALALVEIARHLGRIADAMEARRNG